MYVNLILKLMRPSLMSAGFNFSIWLVVMMRILPSWVATPLIAFKSLDSDIEDCYFLCSCSFTRLAPIASMSSSKIMHFSGSSANNSFRRLSLRLGIDMIDRSRF